MSFLSPHIIQNLDDKLDDGIAYTGNIIGIDGEEDATGNAITGNCACDSRTATCSTDYNISIAGNQCHTLLKLRPDLM